MVLLKLIRVRETLFSLPLAYVGVVLAAEALPSFSIWFYVTTALVSARTLGMCLNRIFDKNIDAACSQDGRLGVVFENGCIRFREFDGESWGGLIVVDEEGGEFPQIKYSRNVPFVVYISNIGDGMNNILYSRRDGEAFSVPDVLAQEKNYFDKVFCYDASAASYEDLTSAAASDSTGDIFHTDSSTIFKDTGDAIYLGLDNKFHYLKLMRN